MLIVEGEKVNTRPFSIPAVSGFMLALAVVGTAVMAPLGSRLGVWDFNSASQILRWSSYSGVLAVLLCLAGTIQAWPRTTGRRGFLLGFSGLILLLPALALPAYWNYAKQQFPPIQDISTDMEDPPEFWYAPNSRVYGSEDTAVLQWLAYPDIEPLVLPLPPDRTHEHVVNVVRILGWELHASMPEEGRVEATATTFWFGFSDDVVVRIREENGNSRIDVRSTSRFGGGGDGGANANRIRIFFATLNNHVGEAAQAAR